MQLRDYFGEIVAGESKMISSIFGVAFKFYTRVENDKGKT